MDPPGWTPRQHVTGCISVPGLFLEPATSSSSSLWAASLASFLSNHHAETSGPIGANIQVLQDGTPSKTRASTPSTGMPTTNQFRSHCSSSAQIMSSMLSDSLAPRVSNSPSFVGTMGIKTQILGSF
ncbi:hypothetical protein TMEN_5166 [Trichophyton mentagrophytes]|nr:hypothetical protein TMEN_5166 [Trichophyton mentagrophytes]